MNFLEKKAAPSPQRLIQRLWIVFIITIVVVLGFPAQISSARSVTRPTELISYPYLEENDLRTNDGLPTLYDFVRELKNGNSQDLVGLYVPGIMAYSVAQQPNDQPGFVLNQPGYVTQFRLANQYGTIGLLAHNNLAGESFFFLKQSQEVILVFGDGSLKYYLLTDFKYFQALSPNSPYSDFIEINHPNSELSVEQLFGEIYGQGDRLVLQTCIEANGQASWGRFFVIGSPIEKSLRRSFQYKIEKSWYK